MKVPTGAFVARRNGKVFVTGNSGFPKSHDVSKAIDKAAGAKREVIGVKPGHEEFVGRSTKGHLEFKNGSAGFDRPWMHDDEARENYHLLTAPSTNAAKQWQGYGTALKPAHEEILVARKPFTFKKEQDIIHRNLSKLECKLWSLLPVNVVVKNFGLNQKEYKEACDFAQWSAEERSSIREGLLDQMDMSQFVSTISMCLNTVISWKNILAESCIETSMFTTGTKSNTIIDWKTLRSCSSEITPLIIIQEEMRRQGSLSSASLAARILDVTARSIKDIQELFVLGNAIKKEPTLLQEEDEVKVSPAWEPVLLCRKPLEGTVAANVLQYGTGAMNIDASRIGLNGDYKCGANGRPSQTGLGDNYQPDVANQHSDVGRWPANLIHDGSEEVIALFPQSKDGVAVMRNRDGGKHSGNTKYGKRNADIKDAGYGGQGSAARFFYCAKANKRDRGEGNNHPTVKPASLMEYLVKLVTPTGGTCLDLFMGSGSTGVACGRLGVNFIGIEKDKEHGYMKIALKRIREAYA